MAGYIGIGGVAKKIKNIYFGVGGVAKQVKKAYIGVGGVAKLWYVSGPDIEKQSNATDLAAKSISCSCAAVGNYSLVGLCNTIDRVGGVDAYNSSLTKTSVWYASYDYAHSGAALSDCVLFAGNKLSKITSTLQRTYVNMPTGVSSMVFQSNGAYVISQKSNLATPYSINSSMTASLISGVTNGVNGLSSYTQGFQPTGCEFNNNAIFAGGYDSSLRSYVKRFDQSLSRSDMTALAVPSRNMSPAANNAYAIFSPGFTMSQGNKFNCYNTSYTRSLVNNPYSEVTGNQSIGYQLSIGNGAHALFAGGFNETTSTIIKAVVDITNTLTLVSLDDLTTKRFFNISNDLGGGNFAGQIGDYFLFPGGLSGTSVSDSNMLKTVEVYKVL